MLSPLPIYLDNFTLLPSLLPSSHQHYSVEQQILNLENFFLQHPYTLSSIAVSIMSETQTPALSKPLVPSFYKELAELIARHQDPLQDEIERVQAHLDDKRIEMRPLEAKLATLRDDFKQIVTSGLDIDSPASNRLL
jgi:hypothetical protein